MQCKLYVTFKLSVKLSFSLTFLSNPLPFMVCSYYQIPRLVQRRIKMVGLELCESVHTVQRQKSTQIPIGFCTHFIGICVGLCLGVVQCECTIRVHLYWG